MATYTLKEQVHVDLRVNGEDLSGDFGPGEIELPEAVAEHLVGLGLATPTTAKKAAKSTPVEESAEA